MTPLRAPNSRSATSFPVQLTVAWLCAGLAQLTHVSEEQMRRETVKAGAGGKPSFEEALAGRLEDSAKVLLLSPKEERERFHEFLRAQRPELARRVVGSEPMPSPSDIGLAEAVSRHFRKTS